MWRRQKSAPSSLRDLQDAWGGHSSREMRIPSTGYWHLRIWPISRGWEASRMWVLNLGLDLFPRSMIAPCDFENNISHRDFILQIPTEPRAATTRGICIGLCLMVTAYCLRSTAAVYMVLSAHICYQWVLGNTTIPLAFVPSLSNPSRSHPLWSDYTFRRSQSSSAPSQSLVPRDSILLRTKLLSCDLVLFIWQVQATFSWLQS